MTATASLLATTSASVLTRGLLAPGNTVGAPDGAMPIASFLDLAALPAARPVPAGDGSDLPVDADPDTLDTQDDPDTAALAWLMPATMPPAALPAQVPTADTAATQPIAAPSLAGALPVTAAPDEGGPVETRQPVRADSGVTTPSFAAAPSAALPVHDSAAPRAAPLVTVAPPIVPDAAAPAAASRVAVSAPAIDTRPPPGSPAITAAAPGTASPISARTQASQPAVSPSPGSSRITASPPSITVAALPVVPMDASGSPSVAPISTPPADPRVMAMAPPDVSTAGRPGETPAPVVPGAIPAQVVAEPDGVAAPLPAPVVGTPAHPGVKTAVRADAPPPLLAIASSVAPSAATSAAPVASAAQIFAEAIHRSLGDDARDPVTTAPAGTSALPPIAAPAVAAARGGTVDMQQHAWPEAMIAQIERLRDMADANDTSIRLVPDALGAIDVSLKRDGEAVQVTMHAEQAQTRALLAEAQPRLHDLAEQRGLKLQTPIGTGSGGSGNAPPQQQQQQARQQQPSAPPSAFTRQQRRDAPDDARLA